jgi:predicted transcriptional regulator
MTWSDLRALLRKTVAILFVLLAADALGWTIYLTILRSSESSHLESAVRGVALTATVVLAVALIAAVSVWRLERPERITNVDMDVLAQLDQALARLDAVQQRLDGLAHDLAEDRSMLHDVARAVVAVVPEVDRQYHRINAVEERVEAAATTVRSLSEITTAGISSNGNGNGTTYRAAVAVEVSPPEVQPRNTNVIEIPSQATMNAIRRIAEKITDVD